MFKEILKDIVNEDYVNAKIGIHDALYSLIAERFSQMYEDLSVEVIEGKKKLDPVGKEDDDVDNDGDSDSSDTYLKKRRNAIGRAIASRNESTELDEAGRSYYGKAGKGPSGMTISKGRQMYLDSPEGKESLERRKKKDAKTKKTNESTIVDREEAVMEYLEGYFGNELNESISDHDIMEAFEDLLETADAVLDYLEEAGMLEKKK